MTLSTTPPPELPRERERGDRPRQEEAEEEEEEEDEEEEEELKEEEGEDEEDDGEEEGGGGVGDGETGTGTAGGREKGKVRGTKRSSAILTDMKSQRQKERKGTKIIIRRRGGFLVRAARLAFHEGAQEEHTRESETKENKNGMNDGRRTPMAARKPHVVFGNSGRGRTAR